MKKQWQNKQIREESVPVQRGDPVAIEPAEDLNHVMEARLFIIPEADEDTEGLPQDAAGSINEADRDFAFAEIQVHGWGMVPCPNSPHGALYFDAEVWADRPHRHIAATYERHSASKGGNR